MKILSKKHLSKTEREHKVLFSLIELYIKNSQPIGSKTLMETSFQGLSSATIRNYFATLEEDGYLSQQHVSGGRIPTEKAYKVYAEEFLKSGTIAEEKDKKLRELAGLESKEIGVYLQKALELLGEVTGYPVFISAPRFDHDFVIDIKLVIIDSYRLLSIIITELGQIHTEILYIEEKLHHHAVKRIEEVLLGRIKGQEIEMTLMESDERLAQKIYNEIMVRFVIGYANFTLEDIYTTGLSRLLLYPEFNNPEAFASGLSLFENKENLRGLLRETCRDGGLQYFIGEDLTDCSPLTKNCAALSIPYRIGEKTVGAIGIFGPLRMPYKALFGVLRAFSEYMSTALTKSMMKYKLTYRTPADGALYLTQTTESGRILLEDKTKEIQ